MRGSMKNQPDKPGPPFTVKEIAKYLKCPFEGNGKTKIKGISSIENAQKGDLVFCSKKKYRKSLKKSLASAAIIPRDQKFDQIPVIKSENPHLSFIRVIELLYQPERPKPGVHELASVSQSADIGSPISVGAFSYIGDHAVVGDGTIIFPHVTIYPNVKIGRNCIIHSNVSIRSSTEIGNQVIIHNGVILGSDGFGYIKKKDSSYAKIPQRGKLLIKDNVEIGANTTVDRASLDDTIIHEGVKIDNLVQIAHNVEIGENSIIAGQSGISGSVKVGKNVIMGGQAGIADHIRIGDDVIIAAKSGVSGNIRPKSIVAGYPHRDIRTWRKIWASLSQLRPMMKEVNRLKKRIQKLENQNKNTRE
ncbi:MAG: UDP-3-O-(3-hydroxymyristoyl)glucosamine N-acyltransferase [Candidatus Aminicenantes bacterium]|nr:UDP-3-O-(3-hydroxymyristoyl)glucosamine N-acyltransferase [Candidatus Aminicenantes bacterium]